MTTWLKDRTVLLLCAALLVVSGCSAVATGGGPFTLKADRSTVVVTKGSYTVFAVAVSGGPSGATALTVSGAPAGTTTSVGPNPLPSAGYAFVSVLTSASTPLGTFPLTVTATRGAETRTAVVRLVVKRFLKFSLRLTPPSVTVVNGGTARYPLRIDRGVLTGPVKLKVTGLPAGVSASATPSLSVVGRTAAVNVRVGVNVVPGTYLITVTGTGWATSSSASAYLVVVPQSVPDFPISGTADVELGPGGPSGAVDLALVNPRGTAMVVTGLTASVVGTPECGPENFEFLAYTGPAALTVPAGSTRTLSQLGVPRDQWPHLQMLNLPTNQDACKGAVVALQFSGTGSGLS